MSEFSESFHLRGGAVDDAVALLRAAGVAGYIAPAAAGWVSFAYEADEPPGRAHFDAVLRAAGARTLLHWDYAADHGCTATLYEGGARVGRIRVSFESRRASFEREAFLSRGLLTPEGAEDVAQWLQYAIPGTTLAERLRLPRTAWFAYDYAARARAAGQTSDLVHVDEDGRTDEERAPVALPGGGATTPWETLANRALDAWLAGGLVELADGAARATLVDALADLFAREPPPDAADVEELLLDHESVAEVFVSGPELVRAARG
ncbi:MAG: hypothetical protein U0235_18145 [Polyangiaceae bacterium]